MCKHPNKNCPCCRDKDKEIKNLRKLVTELESSYENINEDFAVCNERCSDLEDRLYREKKLRKIVERELREFLTVSRWMTNMSWMAVVVIIVTVHHQVLKNNVSPSQKLNEATGSLVERLTGEVKKGQG